MIDLNSKLNLDEIINIRHEIHSHPELGNCEYNTSEIIKDYLKTLDIEICQNPKLPKTSVIGLLKGEKADLNSKSIAFRADIDALNLDENTNLPWSSKNKGIMHACGHDFHTASLLGAAYLLSKERQDLSGNILFIFQPDEEGNGGAKYIVDSGILKDNNVSFVLGAHVDPMLPKGNIGLRAGAFYAASDMFTVTVKGKSCHGAQPEQGIDALRAASEMVTELASLTKTDSLGERQVVSIGKFTSGSRGNIISDKSSFEGIIRSFGQENRLQLRKSLREIINKISDKYGTDTNINLIESYPGIYQNEDNVNIVKEILIKSIASHRVNILQEPKMTTEDFGYYIQDTPGCFFHFGVGGNFPLHHPRFYPEDKLISMLSQVHYNLALSLLAQPNN